jgi:uncharacterized membrane protein
MFSLIAASSFFVLIHFGVSGTRLRDVLVARMGAGPYRGAFAVASLVGIVWMIRAYNRAPAVDLWGQLIGLRPLAFALVLIAFLFVAIGLATPSPTRVGMETKLAQGTEIVRGIVRITRHPFLWGVGLWAFVHLIVNGDLASVILFGSLLLLALGGTVSIDAKRRRSFGDQWSRFIQATSNVPFAAIAAGRNQLRPALREIGILRPVIAIAAYALFFVFHGRLFGAPLV